MSRYYSQTDKNKKDKMIAAARWVFNPVRASRKPYSGMTYGEVGKKIRGDIEERKRKQEAVAKQLGL